MELKCFFEASTSSRVLELTRETIEYSPELLVELVLLALRGEHILDGLDARGEAREDLLEVGSYS